MGTKDTLKQLKNFTIKDLFADSVFKNNLGNEMRIVVNTITSVPVPIKRHPAHRLHDAGLWNVNGLIKVYTEYFIDKSKHYPQSIREFVLRIISIATRKTIQYYNENYRNVSTKESSIN